MEAPLSRRAFVKSSAVAAAALPLSRVLASTAAPVEPAVKSGGVPASIEGPGVALHWLESDAPVAAAGVAWGVPWPRGERSALTGLALLNQAGSSLPVQSWPTAYWPDGSIKWSGHAALLSSRDGAAFRLASGTTAEPASGLKVTEAGEDLVVDTGVITARIPRSGSLLVRSISRGGRVTARDGRLVGIRQSAPEVAAEGTLTQHTFDGVTEKVTVEQSGPVRGVVKIEGKHREADGRAWLPFTVRLYFFAGSEGIRFMHTFVFDGDEHRDFIKGLGVRFSVAMSDSLQDRHVRFSGEGRGQWGEAVRPLTGLRRDAGIDVRAAQVAGKSTPAAENLPPLVGRRLHLIPAWGDFTLSQLNADGFQIRKRTKPGHGWIPAGAGHRASGVGYVGGVSGGLVFGQRDFWQRHPTQLDIRGAASDAAEVTLWLWSPDAPSMDLRFYHDGLGMDTHAKQVDGMEITYEDYEPGFGTPMGVARSNELFFWAVASTPARDELAAFTDLVRQPPMLASRPEYYAGTGVLGRVWSVADRSSPAKAALEDRQDFLLKFYMGQVEQRRWYGFWDYGDVMHTYDVDRHVWRYDIGGFAWDNSELSPDLWLWLSYLRTGRADVFRLAEAMTRHTGEVDVHHLGRFKGLGSRHNVQHWGCSAKQVRVSNAAYRRYYYYLSTDERIGDLLHETAESHRAYLTLLATRKVQREPFQQPGPEGRQIFVGVGTDWGSIASAWLTEWERTQNPVYRDRLLNSMKGIAALPMGFFSGGGLMDIETGVWTPRPEQRPRGERLPVSHLNSVFGLVEVCAELIDVLPVPEFEAAWLKYCELYNADPEEQEKALGKPLAGNGLTVGHSRLTAYAAMRKKDALLAARAWKEMLAPKGDSPGLRPLKLVRVEGPHVLSPVDEAPGVSTNDTAQSGLATIQLLAWAGNAIPPI
jgi:hypothetical protein